MSQCCHAHLRYLEIRHVILSAAKDLARLPPRSFAALQLTEAGLRERAELDQRADAFASLVKVARFCRSA